MDKQELMQRVGHLQQWGGTRLVTLEDGSERGVQRRRVQDNRGPRVRRAR